MHGWIGNYSTLGWVGDFKFRLRCCLTGIAADGGAMERAEALASLVSTARSYWDPPQLNAIRLADLSPSTGEGLVFKRIVADALSNGV